MALIFYRNKSSGKLTGVFKSLKWSDEELNKRVAEFNANEGYPETAEVVDSDERLEFLFNKAAENKLFSQQAIQEALDALDTARDYINCLEVAERQGIQCEQ